MTDIETAPNKAFVWSLFKVNVSVDQIVQPGYTLCWAARWLGSKETMFSSIQKDGKEAMLKKIYDLISEADVIITYNGSSFDLPTLNKDFAELGWAPPAPYQQIDLLQVVRKRFRFPSNKLSYVSKALNLQGKLEHKGMMLWVEVMEGNEKSWEVMEAYNKQDVAILEKLYHKLRPWVTNHPNHGLWDNADKPVCPNCGGHHLQKRGFHHTKTQSYQRLHCQDCGAWSRVRTTILDKEHRKNIIVGVN